MEIWKSGARPTKRAPEDYFTGDVWQDLIIEAPAPARITARRVSFSAGARTAWHTHPLGQTLHVVSGAGRFQLDGQPVREILPGDTIWIEPGERHWHGAAPDCAMVHIAMQEALDGHVAEWMEKVDDETYLAAPSRG